MNKRVTPKQLELTAGKTREELLVQSLPSHIDPEGPAFKADLAKLDKIEREEAARTVLGLDLTESARRSGFVFDEPEKDDFDWNTDDSIILKEQRATAAYRNRKGELIIRQQAGWCDDNDTFVFISPENEIAFMEGLAKRAKE